MYGERGRIGLITLATDTSVLPEFQRLVPEGVQVCPAPITLPRGEVTPEALAEMLATDELEQAAAKLAWTGVQIILFACTTGSLVHGVGWDTTLADRITAASGIPATTTTTAVLAALERLEASRLVVATPYIEALNEIERAFLEASGFSVLAIEGLGCQTDEEIGRLGPDDAALLLERIVRPEADAIFISCTNWHVVGAVPALESAYGICVVTSNLAGAWFALRAIRILDTGALPGALFSPSGDRQSGRL
jgi:maleate isomerase